MWAAPCTLFWPRSGLTPAPGPPEVAGEQREVGEAHDRLGALVVFGEAEAVERDRGRGGGVEAGRGPDVVGVDAAVVAATSLREERADEGRKSSSPSTRSPRNGLVGEALVEDRGRQRVEDEHVRAGPRLQEDVGVLGELDAAGVDDDESRAAQRRPA